MKNKNQKKKSVKKSVRKSKARNYESHYLLIALAAFLLLEGILMTSTTTEDWQKGVAVLDVSTTVSQTMADIKVTLQPINEVVANVDQFYQLAANEMTEVLDLSDADMFSEVALITGGIAEFYQEATDQMIALLDRSSWSESSLWTGNIAGTSISF
jgi:hypothetical protein